MNYKTITSRELLVQHLKNESNNYTNFILQKLTESPLNLAECEKHHIIPRHCGGPDADWNLIYLSSDDHKKAHELRYEVYRESGDGLALKFWRNAPLNTLKAKRIRAAWTHDYCKQQGKAFYSSEQQSKSGKKGGAVKSDEKKKSYIKKLSPQVQEKLQAGTIWSHPLLTENLIVPANKVSLVIEFKKVFEDALSINVTKYNFINLPTTSFSSSVSKVLKGQRKRCWDFTLLKDRPQ